MSSAFCFAVVLFDSRTLSSQTADRRLVKHIRKVLFRVKLTQTFRLNRSRKFYRVIKKCEDLTFYILFTYTGLSYSEKLDVR